MRLFIALPVQGAALEELSRLVERCAATDWPVRWARPDGLHVTLKFLGEVGPERVAPIAEMLGAAVARTGPLPCHPGEIGGFPDLGRARVLWAGYEGEPALELLAHRVEDGAQRLGFAVEGRPFRVHVTLGRLRDGKRLSPEALGRLEAMTLRESFVADRVVLYRSHPGPGGSRYESLESFTLES